MFAYRDTRTPRERELQEELDRLRYEEEQRREQEEQNREERDRQRKRRYEEEYRTAASWPEALSKNAYLFQQEQDNFPGQPDDTFFGDGAAACRRGLEIWREVEASKKAEIEALQKQIEAIREGVKAEVSEKLEAEANGRSGWSSVAGAIVTEDPTNWLNW